MAKINSNAKGKAGELEFANLCKEYGFETRRSQQYCGINSDSDVVGLPGLHVEVKRVEKLHLSNAMEQACGDMAKGDMPIIAHRKNREDWMITMRFEDWMEIYKRYLLTI